MKKIRSRRVMHALERAETAAITVVIGCLVVFVPIYCAWALGTLVGISSV